MTFERVVVNLAGPAVGHTRGMQLSPEAIDANRRLLRHLGFGRVPETSEPRRPDRCARPARSSIGPWPSTSSSPVAGGLDGAAGGRWLDALGVRDVLDPARPSTSPTPPTACGSRTPLGRPRPRPSPPCWASGLLDEPPSRARPPATTVLPGRASPSPPRHGWRRRPAHDLAAAHDLPPAWPGRCGPTPTSRSARLRVARPVRRPPAADALRWVLGDLWA